MPADGPEALRPLERALRQMLVNADGGALRFDLASALVDVAIDVLDRDPGEPGIDVDVNRCITLADLNAMFALSLGEDASLAPSRFNIQLDERDAAIDEIAGFLIRERDVIDVIMSVAASWSCVAASPEGTADMVSDDGIGLYEFTVDDGVYFFTHGELDVDEARWWFAHTVSDADTRADATEAGRAAIGARDSL